jgi:hypothetical protein
MLKSCVLFEVRNKKSHRSDIWFKRTLRKIRQMLGESRDGRGGQNILSAACASEIRHMEAKVSEERRSYV